MYIGHKVDLPITPPPPKKEVFGVLSVEFFCVHHNKRAAIFAH